VTSLIPVVGSVYTSSNEMSELLLESDTESFQQVKFVEYSHGPSYTVAFNSAQTPDVIGDATGNEEIVTLFIPMAPDPVMGGFVGHVSAGRVGDMDVTVEQGIRSIVTSGVAIGDDDPRPRGLTHSQMRELEQVQRLDNQTGASTEEGVPHNTEIRERCEEYDENVGPENSETSASTESRTDDATVGRAVEGRPGEVTREVTIGSDVESTPAEAAAREASRAEQTGDRPPAEPTDRDPDWRADTDAPPAQEGEGGGEGEGDTGSEGR
jgi:hypothetical protein